MHWIVASLVLALFLGVYELCTNHAIRDNAVVPVLFFSTVERRGSLDCFAGYAGDSAGAFAGVVGQPIHSRWCSTCNWH
jgi:hypothetical protein